MNDTLCKRILKYTSICEELRITLKQSSAKNRPLIKIYVKQNINFNRLQAEIMQKTYHTKAENLVRARNHATIN